MCLGATCAPLFHLFVGLVLIMRLAKKLFISILVLLCCAGHAQAAKKWKMSLGIIGGAQEVSSPTCDEVKRLASWVKDVECTDEGAAAQVANTPPYLSGFFKYTYKTGSGVEKSDTATVSVSGTCKKDDPAGSVSLPMYYSKNGEIVQRIRSVADVKGSVNACAVVGVSEGMCSGVPTDGVSLMECDVTVKETGEDGK